jgi:hypothetical protein
MAPATLSRPGQPPPARSAAPGWGQSRASGLTKCRAEDLLDWLEARGWRGRLSPGEAGAGFTVEYDAPGQ